MSAKRCWQKYLIHAFCLFSYMHHPCSVNFPLRLLTNWKMWWKELTVLFVVQSVAAESFLNFQLCEIGFPWTFCASAVMKTILYTLGYHRNWNVVGDTVCLFAPLHAVWTHFFHTRVCSQTVKCISFPRLIYIMYYLFICNFLYLYVNSKWSYLWFSISSINTLLLLLIRRE